MSKEATIYIVRHGESEGNVNKIVSGHTDHNLTPLGVEQATNLGKRFGTITFDRVFSSDLIRAKRTAELITLNRNLAIETSRALRERDYGDLEGKTSAELHTQFDLWKNLSEREQLKQRPAKNAESGEEITARFITFLREVAVGYPGKTILIATHGGVMYSFLVHVGAAADHEIKKVGNTAWILVESDGIDFRINEMEGVVIEHESKSINN